MDARKKIFGTGMSIAAGVVGVLGAFSNSWRAYSEVIPYLLVSFLLGAISFAGTRPKNEGWKRLVDGGFISVVVFFLLGAFLMAMSQ